MLLMPSAGGTVDLSRPLVWPCYSFRILGNLRPRNVTRIETWLGPLRPLVDMDFAVDYLLFRLRSAMSRDGYALPSLA